MTISRRRFVGGAAAAAAVGAVAPAWLPRLARAGTTSSALITPSDCPIDHIVVLTMENRSFDHYFGALALPTDAGGRGRIDVDGLTGTEMNQWSDGTPQPVFPLGGTTCNRLDPPHEWESVRIQQSNGEGGYLRAVEAHYPAQASDARAREANPDAGDVMGYYTAADIPFAWGAAEHFTICDAYRSPVAGPTLPNRHYLHAASSHGVWDNYLDSRPRSASPSPQGDPTYGFEWRTIYQEFAETRPDLEWRVYFVEAPFTMLYKWPREQMPQQFRPFSQFLVDALAGDLPAYTTIDPGYFTASDHAPQNVELGQLFIASVYAALAASPAWDRTALFVTYDEDGGFYDHGRHELVPDDHGSRFAGGETGADIGVREAWDPASDESEAPWNGEHADDPLYADFSLTGGRLPTMVIGPWAKEHHVSHAPADHTSILAFAEWRFGLNPLSERDRWRRAAGHDMTDCFDFSGSPRRPVVLPVPAFHVSMLTDCASTYAAPPAPFVPGPRDPSNPALDLNAVLADAIAAGAIPSIDAATVQASYRDAFRLAASLPDLI